MTKEKPERRHGPTIFWHAFWKTMYGERRQKVITACPTCGKRCPKASDSALACNAQDKH